MAFSSACEEISKGLCSFFMRLFCCFWNIYLLTTLWFPLAWAHSNQPEESGRASEQEVRCRAAFSTWWNSQPAGCAQTTPRTAPAALQPRSPQEADASTQEPNANTLEPDANTQEPDANTQEPDANTQEPNANTQEPNASTQEPNASPQEPALHHVAQGTGHVISPRCSATVNRAPDMAGPRLPIMATTPGHLGPHLLHGWPAHPLAMKSGQIPVHPDTVGSLLKLGPLAEILSPGLKADKLESTEIRPEITTYNSLK